ncbi:MAG TPA: GNAT family N-acetyltransferase [Rhizomicrobium sp.]|nr:GNAT family N-acetyltransferase [Rhizomicrobium sp.]
MDKYDAAKSTPSSRCVDSEATSQNTVDAAFEPGIRTPDGKFIFMKHPSPVDFVDGYAMAQRELGPNIASPDVIKSIYRYNPMSHWVIMRSPDETRKGAELVGFFSLLPLNVEGKAALEAEKIDLKAPDLAFIVKPGEDPEAIYLWSMVMPGLGNIGLALLARAIGPDLFERTPLTGWISTQAALDAIRRSSKSREYADAKIGSSFRLTFPEEFLVQMRTMPIVEGKRPPAVRTVAKHRLEVKLVSTAEMMAQAMAIRAAVFMTEQNCPYEEEFDGNDYAGGHVLGFVDGQPAAVVRIRYFADFVKFERFAILPRYRRTLIARAVGEYTIEMCRRKGYRRMYAHLQARLVGLWKRFGFVQLPGSRPFAFSDHDYVEIAAETAPHPNRLTMESDPLVLIRPEGDWDRPGVLDLSARRPPTNPH